ncbi:hypothetical protein PYV61_13660, partial [Roseisolibacter sp. H3M3-2]
LGAGAEADAVRAALRRLADDFHRDRRGAEVARDAALDRLAEARPDAAAEADAIRLAALPR